MNNSNLSLPNVIDGVTGSNNIVNMWKSHYGDLFNSLYKDKDVSSLCKKVDCVGHRCRTLRLSRP